jgi:hypothetical protein
VASSQRSESFLSLSGFSVSPSTPQGSFYSEKSSAPPTPGILSQSRPTTKTARDKFTDYVKRVDMFPYRQPYSIVTSHTSGCITILVFVLFITVALMPEVKKWSDSVKQYNIVKGTSKEMFGAKSLPLDPIAITTDAFSKFAKPPYRMNMSYYWVDFNERVIYESDSNPAKPREIRNLGTRVCEIKLDNFGGESSRTGWCPSETGRQRAVGNYDSQEYRYLQVDLIPCYEYDLKKPEFASVACAPKAAILDLFHGPDSYASFAAWNLQTNALTGKSTWKSVVYVTIPRQQWLGVEMYNKPVKTVQYNAFEDVTHNVTNMVYERFELRTSSLRSTSFLRYYVRQDDVGETTTITVYTLIQVIQGATSLAVLLVSIGRVLGQSYNEHRSIFKSFKIFFKNLCHCCRHGDEDKDWTGNSTIYDSTPGQSVTLATDANVRLGTRDTSLRTKMSNASSSIEFRNEPFTPTQFQNREEPRSPNLGESDIALDTSRCKGITGSGQQCKSLRVEGTEYCHRERHRIQGEETGKSERGETHLGFGIVARVIDLSVQIPKRQRRTSAPEQGV